MGTVSSIYDEDYKGTDAQKNAVSYYMSQIPMSNPMCESALYDLGSNRQDFCGSKAGTVGYIFQRITRL